MTKTLDQQKTLNTIWHDLHEKKRRSAEAAQMAHQERQKETADSEMALELAAMEFVTASAAAKDSSSFKDAHPFFLQASQVVQDVFPFADNLQEAQKRGNVWDKVYGDQNAQFAMLRNYFHLIHRLQLVVSTEQFETYSHNLWKLLVRLSEEYQDDTALCMLRIEHEKYPKAKQAYITFLNHEHKETNLLDLDFSRLITVSSRMMNRALQERDYDMTLRAFTVALRAVKSSPDKLTHFARQVASNVRVDKDITEKKKLRSWQAESTTSDLNFIQNLLKLTFFGLGKDKVESFDKLQ